jgi:hypothetical protein
MSFHSLLWGQACSALTLLQASSSSGNASGWLVA